MHIDAAARDGLHHHAVLAGVKLHGVVLDPAGLRIDLRKFLLRRGDDVLRAVKDDGAAAGRALIECDDVFFHRPLLNS